MKKLLGHGFVYFPSLIKTEMSAIFFENESAIFPRKSGGFER